MKAAEAADRMDLVLEKKERVLPAAACVLVLGSLYGADLLGGCSRQRSPREQLPEQQAPRITASPQDRTAAAGTTVTFSVAASGKQPLVYEWRKNNLALHAVSTASYTTPVLTVEDNGTRYSVVVANDLGAVLSQPAKLTVKAPVRAAAPGKGLRTRRLTPHQ